MEPNKVSSAAIRAARTTSNFEWSGNLTRRGNFQRIIQYGISAFPYVRQAAMQTEEEDVTLRGGEKMRVRLRFKGLQAGTLRVNGVHWRLENIASGYKALQLHQLPQPRSR